MIFQKKWIVIFVVLCLGACSVNLVPSKDAWYAQHYIIMQEFEWESYKSLSDAGKLQFQELFWTVRDPSAKATFMARLDFANENFRKEKSSQPWNTDRGRIYLLNGRPAEVRYVENDNLGGIGIIPAGGRRHGPNKCRPVQGRYRCTNVGNLGLFFSKLSHYLSIRLQTAQAVEAESKCVQQLFSPRTGTDESKCNLQDSRRGKI